MPDFQVMTKPHGPICNLDCSYCYYLEKENLYPDQTQWRMSPEVLESFIRQYIQAQEGAAVTFVWQGGEPTLLGVEFFQTVIALQQRHAGGKKIENAFQTNGILLDDAWCEFLAANKFLVGLSIDGPAHLHDAYRLDRGGQPTFDRVMRALNLLKRHKVEFNTLTVVNRKNSYFPAEVYAFLKEIGSKYIQFIPVVEMKAHEPTRDGLVLLKPYSSEPAAIAEWSVEPQQYGKFLQVIFDEWVRNDVGRTFVQILDVALESWAGLEQSLCVFKKQCGDAMVLEQNGDLYSCDHFVYPENLLGNILDRPLFSMARSPSQKRFGQLKSTRLPEYCEQCDVRFACNGECPKHRFSRTPSGEPGLNYLCAAYKHFFKHIDPYMKFMARELFKNRAPANVMAWARRRDLDPASNGSLHHV
jgi:uncharacterized protein